ncbi:hypothetical protein K5Q02_14115 [Pseudomonas sp. MM211]|nr:hypothetical protein [Pseudomonas sp. MM211]UCJ15007.1 hypothetical protein K5Q02_14115 [Pseudomonas sp. MM211]
MPFARFGRLLKDRGESGWFLNSRHIGQRKMVGERCGPPSWQKAITA